MNKKEIKEDEIKEEEMKMESGSEDETESSEEDEDMEEDEEDGEGNKTQQEESKVYLPGQQLEEGEHLVVDKSAYRMLHEAQASFPCLSFDIIRDNLGEGREEFPLSLSFVAGTQAAKTHVNHLLVIQMSNLMGTKENDSDDSEDDDDDDENEGLPVMKVASIKHQGCVNRVRYYQINPKNKYPGTK